MGEAERRRRVEVFNMIFETKYQKLYMYANGVLRNKEDAQDAVMAGVNVAWLRFPEFYGSDDGMYFWLLRVVKNAMRNALKQQMRDRRRLVPLEDYQDAPQSWTDGVWSEVAVMTKYRGMIPDRDLLMLEMLYVRQMSYSEVAEALGIPENQIGQRAKRGKEKFQQACEK